MPMMIRRYRPEDCGTLAELFYRTVHTVNRADYTPEQVNAWAPGTVDLSRWDRSFRAHYSLVALRGGVIIGFGDIDPAGYLDRLYVHADYQRQGTASALCDGLEAAVPGKITVHASLTARPFFEKRGYKVLREQQVERRGVLLTNCVMEKEPELRRRSAGAPGGADLFPKDFRGSP